MAFQSAARGWSTAARQKKIGSTAQSPTGHLKLLIFCFMICCADRLRRPSVMIVCANRLRRPSARTARAHHICGQPCNRTIDKHMITYTGTTRTEPSPEPGNPFDRAKATKIYLIICTHAYMLWLPHKASQNLTRPVSQGLAKSHKVSQGLTRPHKVPQGLTRSHKASQGIARSNTVSQGFRCQLNGESMPRLTLAPTV